MAPISVATTLLLIDGCKPSALPGLSAEQGGLIQPFCQHGIRASRPKVTMNTYTHTFANDLVGAANSLNELVASSKAK